MSLIALVDGDAIMWQAAACAEKTIYHVSTVDGTKRTFECAADRDAWMKEKGIAKGECEVKAELIVEPKIKALIAAERKLENIWTVLQTRHHELYIGGTSGNYRDAIAKTRVYKGQRSVHKPFHFADVRSWFVEHGARPVEGAEADDACGIRSQEIGDDAVIVSIDKDLVCVPGKHMDPTENSTFNVTPKKALLFFMRQLISGDSADNVVGLPRMGLAKAEKAIPLDMAPAAAWARVQALYAQVKGKDAASYLLEQMQLLWVRRLRGELITPEDFEARYVSQFRKETQNDDSINAPRDAEEE